MGIGTLRRYHEQPSGRDGVPAVPTKNASKAEWVAYALAVGATEADIKDLKRDELRELYGPQDAPPPPPLFDPSTYTPEEVLAYLHDLDGTDAEARDAEVARVIEAEHNGLGRGEILDAIGGTPVDPGAPPAS